MTTFSVPPGCTGVELPNGKKVDANKQGKITLDDRASERFALKSTAANMGALSKTSFSFNSQPHNSNVCAQCKFTGFSWQSHCPKCNGQMTKKKEELQ
jgi:DnaJ-class molecular chaperone